MRDLVVREVNTTDGVEADLQRSDLAPVPPLGTERWRGSTPKRRTPKDLKHSSKRAASSSPLPHEISVSNPLPGLSEERCNAETRGTERGEFIRDELKAHNKSLGRKPTVRCLRRLLPRLCEYGPNMVVQPSGVAYSHLNRATARAVYDAETGDGPPRPDLEFEGQ